MVKRRFLLQAISIGLLVLMATNAIAQQLGSIRGIILDKDFDAPLPAGQVTIVETGETVTASDEGNYLFNQVEPGTYTLVFSKDGYARQVKADVIVSPGQMTEISVSLSGEFAEMEEFVVQDIQLGGGTEIALLSLRMESPALMDSISADLMSKAGAGDAASALKLVAGATVQDGKYAVIRGLPDRYVNSQMNGIRLPTADADKRAVQLDQFPSEAIESVQISKTFTPDQQGDASGGAVNVVLNGIPDKTVLKLGLGTDYNVQSSFRNDFLTYKGGGVNTLGMSDRNVTRDPDDDPNERGGAAGVTRDDTPYSYSWDLTAGSSYTFEDGFEINETDMFENLKVGGLLSLFYDHDSSYYEDGIDDKYWIKDPGEDMSPVYSRGSPEQGDFKTSLFDVTQGKETLLWGGLGVLGIGTEFHSLDFANLYTHNTSDKATLAEDTRGKKYYFPDYDVDDPDHPGNRERDAAPYLRLETLEYTERITRTHQLRGTHKISIPEYRIYNLFEWLDPEFDWSVAYSLSELKQPDKRQLGTLWWAESNNPGFPPYVPPFVEEAEHRPYKPAENFTLGNYQRIDKWISEDSKQQAANVKFPFEQWNENKGYLKIGYFGDSVVRDYDQNSFSNYNDNRSNYEAPWEDFWSEEFSEESHPLSSGDIDVDYRGEQDITAGYVMADIPFASFIKMLGGVRYEKTELSIVNDAEKNVTWIPPNAPGQVDLNPGDADVSFEQKDWLPSIGLEGKPIEQVTLRGSYAETVARQTFKELTPIQQQEYLGADVFIGNPELKMSSLKNYDLRADYVPYAGGLLSASYFYKKIKDPIEYVQRIADFPYTTPVNYPEGKLSGYELEARQKMGEFVPVLNGLSLGSNATFIDSEVTLPEEEAEAFNNPNIDAPMKSRDMTGAPDYLYNIYLLYDFEKFGLESTQYSIFYTVKGDTLSAGAGQSKGNYVPNVYEKSYGTLNSSLSTKITENVKVKLSAKNLLDPKIETVYRSKYLDGDVTKTSYQKGREFSISLTIEF
ncbi:MAG: TonB-dependent receptor domain-containing protein [Candidatus Sumerlaeia bacterium]